MDLPADWTPEHSVALLLVGLSMIDGEVDEQEMRALVGVLRGFPGVDPSAAARIGQQAYKFLWELQEAEGDLVGELRSHAEVLSMAYETSTLQSIHERLIDMANADGALHPMESRLIAAFRHTWGLGADA